MFSFNIRCGTECDPKKCETLVDKVLPCGHLQKVECCKNANEVECNISCNALLDYCNHTCKGSCGKCQQGKKLLVLFNI